MQIHLLPPIRYYNGKVYVLANVVTVEIGDRHLETGTGSSKLIYVLKGDGRSDVALHGDIGPSGTRGLKGDFGDKGPVGSRDSAGKRDVEGHEGPL